MVNLFAPFYPTWNPLGGEYLITMQRNKSFVGIPNQRESKHIVRYLIKQQNPPEAEKLVHDRTQDIAAKSLIPN